MTPLAKRAPDTLGGCAAVLLTAALLSIGCSKTEPLRFEVTFENAAGIERGDPVFHRDIEIGEVTAVGIDEDGLGRVAVGVRDRYRSAVVRESVVRVDRYGLRRRTRLTIEDDPGVERHEVRPGDVLEGSEGPVDDVFDQLKEAAHDALERAGAVAKALGDRLQTLPESPEAQRLAEEIREQGAEMAERSREGWRRFREERVPELIQKAETVRKQLEERGLPEEAEKFWRDFQDWLERAKEEAVSRQDIGSDDARDSTQSPF